MNEFDTVMQLGGGLMTWREYWQGQQDMMSIFILEVVMLAAWFVCAGVAVVWKKLTQEKG